jgi:hypothetical protein
MKTFKFFKNLSLKEGLLILAGGAFIALCTFNVKLGLSDYDKTSNSLFTLEALAGESGGGGENWPNPCQNASTSVGNVITTTVCNSETSPAGEKKKVYCNVLAYNKECWFKRNSGSTDHIDGQPAPN